MITMTNVYHPNGMCYVSKRKELIIIMALQRMYHQGVSLLHDIINVLLYVVVGLVVVSVLLCAIHCLAVAVDLVVVVVVVVMIGHLG